MTCLLDFSEILFVLAFRIDFLLILHLQLAGFPWDFSPAHPIVFLQLAPAFVGFCFRFSFMGVFLCSF